MLCGVERKEWRKPQKKKGELVLFLGRYGLKSLEKKEKRKNKRIFLLKLDVKYLSLMNTAVFKQRNVMLGCCVIVLFQTFESRMMRQK